MTALLATAFTAGLVATVNPCGFAMLPAYLGLFLGRGATTGQALRVGSIVSAGFLLVFGAAGIVIAAGVTALTRVVPWLAIIVGVGLIGGGVAFIRGRSVMVRLPALRGRKRSDGRSLFLFGVSYAVASLSCTIGTFLALVGVTFTRTSFLGAVAVFLVYGLGMSLVLIAVTVAVAAGRDSIVVRLRSTSQYVSRVSGWIMVASGAFIVWYWTAILSAGSVATGGSAAARFVEGLSVAVTGFLGERPISVGVVAAVLAAVAVAAHRRRGRRSGETSPRVGAAVDRFLS